MNDELLQIVCQYLKRNYPEIWCQINIQNDDNNEMQTLSEQQFKEAIIDGKWDDLIEQLQTKTSVKSDENEVIKTTLFKLIEQKIQETLEKGSQTEALEILRSRLSPLKIFPGRIHQLAQDILLMRVAPVNRFISAQEICGELRKVEGLILPENRLEELVEEAREYQKLKCPFHVDNEEEDVTSLWTDHKCNRIGTMKLSPSDVERKEISVLSNGELLNIFMSTNQQNVVVIDDEGGAHVCTINDTNFKTKIIPSHNVMQSITFWPRITDKLPEQNGREIVISNLFGEEEDERKTRFIAENPISIALTSDGQFVICSTEGQNTTIFDTRDGKVVHSWIRLRCSHLLTPRSPEDKYFLAVSDNGEILQISTESFETIKTLQSMNERLQVASAYLDGRRLLIGYNNSTIYYYDNWLEYGHPTRIFRGHTCTNFRVNSILPRCDANLAVSGSENGAICVWNVGSGKLVYEIEMHEKCVNDVVEIGGGRFVTCGDDGKVYEWKLK